MAIGEKMKTLEEEVKKKNKDLVSVEVVENSGQVVLNSNAINPGKKFNYLPIDSMIATAIEYEQLDEYLNSYYVYQNRKWVSKVVEVKELNEILDKFKPFEGFYCALSEFNSHIKDLETWLDRTKKSVVQSETRSRIKMPSSIYDEGKGYIDAALRILNETGVNCPSTMEKYEELEEKAYRFEQHLTNFYNTRNNTQVIMLSDALVGKVGELMHSYPMNCMSYPEEHHIVNLNVLRKFAEGKEKIKYKYPNKNFHNLQEVVSEVPLEIQEVNTPKIPFFGRYFQSRKMGAGGD